mmetsp:Transcript_30571/g.50481  ORF Transcript_30571/g.50481 Transcript_30571/m.50481 type:complete len:88 (-) Transcript_30571:191-454(-)|eukprot:CAMPEP_0119016798 /NCGR_PEP_ID=MMETSP1176-20130426/14470_1 /TAXON_ID=265551 /ORGANISM="Synedropsis recta cf, Strain CCMP1620" /LENGTH=87 /DNA_ID=CAMNT_0006970331 /DNA_START=93 /DNA_END=356 /DNA_ORIENTATION=-
MSEAVSLVDLEAIQGQLGSAVMDLEGKLVRLGGQMTEENAFMLFKMLVEVGMLGGEGFERLSVGFSSCNYSVARDEMHVYVTQTKAL